MTENKLLAAALHYAVDLGWAVFPCWGAGAALGLCACGDPACKSQGKHPCGPLVPHGVKEASKDPAVITAWWAARPGCNVAVATGTVSGFWVLDIDPIHGGDDSLADLIAKLGPLPETVQQITGRLGMHYLMALLADGRSVKNRTGILPGIDTRGDGGYIVVEPSIHGETGRRYAFEVTHQPGECDPAPAPGWLVDLVIAAPQPCAPGNGHPATTLPAKVTAGRRHALLLTLAGILRRRGASKEEILAILLVANANRCDPPKSEAELRKIAADSEKWKPATALDGSDTAENLAARGEEVLAALAKLPRDEVLPALQDDDSRRMLAALKRVRLTDFLSGIDRIRPRGLAVKIEAIVRSVDESEGGVCATPEEARAAARVRQKLLNDPRPEIDVTVRDLDAHVRAGLGAVLAENRKLLEVGQFAGAYFVRGGVLVRMSDDSGIPSAEIVDADALRLRMGEVARWTAWRGTGDDLIAVTEYPARDVAKCALKKLAAGFLRLRGIHRHPVVVRDGDLPPRALTRIGYDEKSETLLWGFDPGSLPVTATRADAQRSAEWLGVELFGDFPFEGPAEKATAFALCFLPFIRPMLSGCVPLHLFEASVQGSGKDLLIDVCMVPALGNARAATLPQGRDDDDWRKRVTSYLGAGVEVIAIRNLKGHFDSPIIEAALTLDTWEDRLLGTNQMARYPNLATWCASGNNMSMSDDMVRRIVRCRIVPDCERPAERTGFRHPRLLDWLTEHRHEALRAAWSCVLAWAGAGCPATDSPVMGSYEDWSRYMGGLLAFCGVPGFLENRRAMADAASSDKTAMRGFLRAWWARHGTQMVDSAMILDLAKDAGVYMKGTHDADQRRSLIYVIGRVKAQIVAGFAVHVVHPADDNALKNTMFSLSRRDATGNLASLDPLV